MLDAVKDQVLSAITNARGWRTSRRIVVFESDDWGAAKARDREALDLMSRAGVNLDVTPYERLDCLESRDDLQALFDTLSKHRDTRERPPIFTFNTILANPDYQAIGEADFEHYVYEDLPQSYERYFGEDLLPMWRSAMDDRLIQAQFHGREHLNVGLWLNDLKSGHKETNAAFEHGFYGQTTSTSSRIQTNYLAAFWPESTSHFAEILQILVDGLSLFRRVFGF